MSAGDEHQGREQDAAAWIARLQSRSISTHDLADFANWRRDPRNAAAYERAEEFWEASQTLRHDPEVTPFINEALGKRHAVRGGFNRLREATAAAAVLALACVTIFFLHGSSMMSQSASYTTIAGQRSVLSLADGTRVQLDTDSKISADMTSRARKVQLSQGRVYFDVEHDPKRPFVVNVDDELTVTAHGTQFDVFRQKDHVDVILYQGSVEVTSRTSGASVTLAPGQTTRMSGSALTPPVPARVAEAALWRSGRLSFNDTRLDQALVEINRYTKRPLRLSRSSLGQDRISGEFSSDDADGFAAAANAIYGAGAVVRNEAAD